MCTVRVRHSGRDLGLLDVRMSVGRRLARQRHELTLYGTPLVVYMVMSCFMVDMKAESVAERR